MPWLDKRINYRLREKIDGKAWTVIKNLGIWKHPAEEACVKFKKAVAAGFVFKPPTPITVADIDAFLKAKSLGQDVSNLGRAIPIESMLDIFVEKHGPSLKGGISESCWSSFYNFKKKVGVLKWAWIGRLSDGITSLDVRDFLARGYERKRKGKIVKFQYNVGGSMKYIRLITTIFKKVGEWNEEGILKPPILLPKFNPGSAWRKNLKPVQKREEPDRRVLSESEWHHFKQFLTARAYRICDIALRRFLRKSDIEALTEQNQSNGHIQGIQAKTGDRFSVPSLGEALEPYDFTNFEKEFNQAKVAADMAWPMGHRLHFSLRSLRRTGATWAYRATKDLDGIRRMLGHRNIATTILYLGLTADDLTEIALVMDKKAAGQNKSGGAPVEIFLENGISASKVHTQYKH